MHFKSFSKIMSFSSLLGVIYVFFQVVKTLSNISYND
jgi:hypothetical protein